MSHYTRDWELNTIPARKWASEHGRRIRARATKPPNIKLAPCSQCGEQLNATQRRKPCPKCGHREGSK